MPTALVTGANRGLGLETCKQLAHRGWSVLLTARDREEAQRAARGLEGSGRFEALQLDVSSEQSVRDLAQTVSDCSLGLLDALVNNAGTTERGFDAETVRRTLDVNYRGAVRVTDALLPQLTPVANIVMVSSGMGELSHFREPIHSRMTDPWLERQDIDAIAQEYVELVGRGEHEQQGFPSNAYTVSKALLNAFTRVLSRELAGATRRANAVCPGWVRTRLGGEQAPRSVEEGARGIVWAATLDESGPRGGFFRDGIEIAW